MSCTGYGQERADRDWTQDELDLLQLELETARKRVALEIGRKVGQSAEYIQGLRDKNSLLTNYAKRYDDVEQKVYEEAHDRHFFTMLKRGIEARAHSHVHRQGA